MKLDPKLLVLGLFVLTGFRKKGAAPTLNIPKGGAQMTLEELRILATQAGFPDPNLAAAVASAESGGAVGAIGDNGDSIGLWQINMPAHPKYSKADLLEPTKNAQAAFEISAAGTNWQPWTMYRNGGYAKFMPPAIASVVQPPAQIAATATPAATSPAPVEAAPVLVEDDYDDERSPPAPAPPIPLEAEDLDEPPAEPEPEEPKTGRARRARRG